MFFQVFSVLHFGLSRLFSDPKNLRADAPVARMKEGFLRMRTGLLPAVALSAVAFSGVAQASVIALSFVGFINSGTDNAGDFGVAGASLAGDTIAFSFSYDTGLLQADFSAGTDGSAEYLYPGTDDVYVDNAGDSAFTESVTINSQTLAIAINAGGVGEVQGCTTAWCGGDDGFLLTLAQTGSGAYIQTNLNTTQNYSTSDNLLSQTEVNALFGGGVTTGEIYIANGSVLDSLGISNVSAESSATPEPTTWISLALGFGVVGLFKRRRSVR